MDTPNPHFVATIPSLLLVICVHFLSFLTFSVGCEDQQKKMTVPRFRPLISPFHEMTVSSEIGEIQNAQTRSSS